MTSSPDTPESTPPRPPDKAAHGYRSEVNWKTGKGRQPYANQGEREQPEPGSPEYPEGDRGERSGRNLQQLEDVKRKP